MSIPKIDEKNTLSLLDYSLKKIEFRHHCSVASIANGAASVRGSKREPSEPVSDKKKKLSSDDRNISTDIVVDAAAGGTSKSIDACANANGKPKGNATIN